MVKFAALFFFINLSTLAFAASSNSDLSLMNQARNMYAKNKLESAIEIYSKIKPESDFWLESIEEKAWAKTRMGQYEEALADLKSIVSPVWSAQLGPETYMLSTFVSLKICAYKDVMAKIKTFKKEIQPRVEVLQKLQDENLTDDQWNIISQLKDKKLTMVNIGKAADQFPRYFFRDQYLIAAVKSNQKAKAQKRIQRLAEQDLDEISANLKKMKVIEVEVIQNVMTLDESTKIKSEKLKFNSVDKNKTLSFPISNDEVWLDEVGHYQVKAQKCPYSSGVKL